jgi:hypothetical protein
VGVPPETAARRPATPGQRGVDLGARLLEPLRRDPVDLGQRDGAAAHAQQAEDRQVLQGLRHRPVVRGNHEQREVDRSHPREHVAQEALVAGHVDEADRQRPAQVRIREPQVDRHALRRSSSRRSVSTPVRARTRLVLPWST